MFTVASVRAVRVVNIVSGLLVGMLDSYREAVRECWYILMSCDREKRTSDRLSEFFV